MPKKFWSFKNQTGGKNAELLLYGDIASEQSWYGDEVTPKQFTRDLEALEGVEEITVRINSGGGDVWAAQTIGNLLEQHSATVTARIDGLCASAATIVASHCDKVIAANDTTYMVHPVKVGICGYVDATELQQYLDALATLKETIIGLYVKKTNKTREEVTGWMDSTSWWTAAQAKENGFVDELVDNEEGAVVENRNGVLFVNSVNTNIPFDKAPKFVQDSMAVSRAAGCFVNTLPAGGLGGTHTKEETTVEIKNTDDLRAAYPELVDQIEQAAAQQATANERQRLKLIDDVAPMYGAEMVNQAKYGESPCDVKELTYRAALENQKRGGAVLNAMQKDSEESGAGDIGNPPAPGGENAVSAAKAKAKADAAAYLESKKGRK